MGNCKSSTKGGVAEEASRSSGSSSGSNDGAGVELQISTATVPSSIEGDGFAIPIKAYRPVNTPIRSAVFLIHGGIFSYGDRESHPTIAEGLAKLGLCVTTASFRNGEEAPHRTNITMRDLRDVIDHTRGEWPDVPFGLVGSSSGGFFALTLMQTLGPAVVSFCIPICPVADPFKRASYLRSSVSGSAASEGYAACHDPTQSARILEKQLSFWEKDEDMKEAADGLKTNRHDIPTLLILGSVDKNVPFEVTAGVQSWATRTIVIGGRGHELCDEVVKGGGYHCYLADIDRFLDYCLSKREAKDG
ncbi:hypothetical protein ACHAXT_009641 [Thalassiosira profunda]